MVFSKEDNQAWESSEVMRELEKMAAEVLEGPSIEAYEPIEEQLWEEETAVEPEELSECECAPGTPTMYDGKICAVCGRKKKEEGFEEEMHSAYGQILINNLEKMASNFAENSKIKVAYRIEQAIAELKELFGGVHND